jgi:non-ribosomal peptide synthetase component F
MVAKEALYHFLDQAAQLYPEHIAVVEPGQGTVTYRELADLADRLRDRLIHLGVGPGDRVGIYLHKSIDAVAALFGILKTGAAYVPVDPGAPAARNAYILNDCSVKAVVVEERFVADLLAALDGEGPQLFILAGTGGGAPLGDALAQAEDNEPTVTAKTVTVAPSDLAYILYTSGSTGRPKGVMLSHQAASSFVNWCSEAFIPNENDRFSSHAPFHFDLSILDIYVPIKHGATLVLIEEGVGKDPLRLAPLIAETRISVSIQHPRS